ncbi:MAG: DUF1232 domain-containing protein, partial [Muribaculaceae bacterium]|nr:DUF1232 domain-containing protein [Muribaculaceae bacterium]
NPTALFEKIKATAKNAGAKVVYYVMILYYALTNDKIPLKDRILVIAALGYFISPFDFIPDFLLAGLLDDMSVLGFVVTRVWKYIDDDVKRQAKEKLHEWFGDEDIKRIKTDALNMDEDLYKLIEEASLLKTDEKAEEASLKLADSVSNEPLNIVQSNNMHFYIPFQQISLYAKLNNNVNIDFAQVSDKELRLTWIQHNIIKDIRLGIKLKIVKVTPVNIIVAYDGGLTKMIISPALSYLVNRLPEMKDSINKEDGNRIRVNLANIEKLKLLLEKIELKDILIEKSGINIIADLRIPLLSHPNS